MPDTRESESFRAFCELSARIFGSVSFCLLSEYARERAIQTRNRTDNSILPDALYRFFRSAKN
jgi:hypothetical protein